MEKELENELERVQEELKKERVMRTKIEQTSERAIVMLFIFSLGSRSPEPTSLMVFLSFSFPHSSGKTPGDKQATIQRAC